MHRLCSVCPALFAILFVLLPVRGANAPWAAPARYRYLFAIDTSEAMATHKDEIARFMGQTIRSGFDGWMRRNETIGFWTFSQKLTRDAFAVQFWSPIQKERLAEQAERWLVQARFGKTSRLDLALAELERVATDSERLTIFLISDGSQPMRGTPFDAAINQIYANLLRSGPTPAPAVITRLTVHEGVFSSWAVLLLQNSSAETKLADLASLETRPSRASSATNLSASSSTATNLAATRADLQANVEKPRESVTAKPLPPPPILAKELFAPIRVGPLQFTEDDEPGKPGKSRKPVFIIPAEPGNAIPNNPKPTETAVARPGDLKEKEKNAPISAPDVELANVKSRTAEPPIEPPVIKVTAAMAQTTVETVAGTNAVESGVEERTTVKQTAESVRETPLQSDSSTSSGIPATPQVRAEPAQLVNSGPALLKKTPEAVNALENNTAKTAGQNQSFALGPSEIGSAAPRTNSPETLPKPALTTAPRSPNNTPAFLFAGLTLLVLAGLLVWLCCRISRVPRQPSLISRSFDRDNKQNQINAPQFLDTRC